MTVKLDTNNPEHVDIVMPYYYAHFRGNEIVNLLKHNNSLDTNIDDIRMLFQRFKNAGIPKFNRERILHQAKEELNTIINAQAAIITIPTT